MLDKSGKISVGAPVIKGAKVTAKIIEHLKGDKVIVFKKKRRKGYKVKNGFRQFLTKLEILSIEEKATKVKKAEVKKEVKSKAKKDSVAKKVVKKSPSKKAQSKKTVAKKSD